MTTFTATQFDALTKHIGLGKETKTVQACRLVLVEGMSVSAAINVIGMAGREKVSNTVKRYRETAQSVIGLSHILK